jgi:AraC-like DNA-binding protein
MILLLGGLGVFLSALLIFYNKGYRSANIYLGLFLFFFNFIILSHYIYIFNQSAKVISFVLSVPINATAYAVGPLAFLYVRSILRDNAKLSKFDWFHFIFLCFFFLGRLLNNLSGWDGQFQVTDEILNNSWKNFSHFKINQFLPMRINYILKAIHLSIYILLIWLLLVNKNFKKSSLDNGINHTKIVKNWLYFFALIITILFFLLATVGFLFFTIEDKISFQYEGNIIFSLIFIGLLILILGLILFPQILYGIPMEKLVLEEIGQVKNLQSDSIAENFSYSEDYMERIKQLLENWTKENKFLDTDTSIYSLAKDINLPVHHISYYFNKINNKGYIDWRNRMRIEYAIGIINNQEETDKTLETLGKVCGFRSYSSFMQNFKQFTGKLPYEYIKEIKQKRIKDKGLEEKDVVG